MKTTQKIFRKTRLNIKAVYRFMFVKNLNGNDLVNRWLVPAYGVPIEYLWETRHEFKEDNSLFYQSYPVNQKRHNRWKAWLVRVMQRKHPYLTKEAVERSIWPIYLNCAPTIK